MAETYQTALEVVSTLPSLHSAAVFLDFDGTLVGFADSPMDVVVPEDLLQLLDRLHSTTSGATALVSGRRLSDFETLMPSVTMPCVGGHGAEWRTGQGEQLHPMAGSEIVAGMQRAAQAFATPRDGVLAEPKPAGVALHFRRAPDRAAEIEAFTAGLAAAHPGFEPHHGKNVCEIRPDDVNKGAALAKLMGMAPFQGRVPVMIGDDATDEPAMHIAQERAGIAIKVGEGTSVARHRVKDPADVLSCLAQWTITKGAAA
ncbi:MAG: trehalose-phosphatase [Pseudomonadota bacterium]